MLRLFVGIELPPELKLHLSLLASGLPVSGTESGLRPHAHRCAMTAFEVVILRAMSMVPSRVAMKLKRCLTIIGIAIVLFLKCNPAKNVNGKSLPFVTAV